MEAPDPNKGEYREWATKIDTNTPLVSIGAMVYGNNLNLVGNVYKTVSQFPYVLENLDSFMGKIVAGKIFSETHIQQDATQFHISKNYKFSPCTILANATCFYVGEGLIATAGHCCFQGATATLKPQLANMKIVFGLSQVEITLGEIPASKVFTIQRVLFGQDIGFVNPADGSKIIDRADWTLLKLNPSAHGANFPQALPIERLSPDGIIEKTWLAGHPWGIGLTYARPPASNPGVCKGIGINAVQHNILTAPANSGGPIFDEKNNVIAVVASGKGDDVMNRGFFYLGGTEIIPMPVMKEFGGSRCNIFHSLFQTNGRLILACELPVVPVAATNRLAVKILVGDGDNQASWTSLDLVQNQPIPADNKVRISVKFSQLRTQTPIFRQYNIRGITFTYNYNSAGGGGGAFIMPMMKNVVFGCLAEGDEYAPHNWVILYKADTGPILIEQTPETIRLPIFLEQNWKIMNQGQIGLWDTRNGFGAF